MTGFRARVEINGDWIVADIDAGRRAAALGLGAAEAYDPADKEAVERIRTTTGSGRCGMPSFTLTPSSTWKLSGYGDDGHLSCARKRSSVEASAAAWVTWLWRPHRKSSHRPVAAARHDRLQQRQRPGGPSHRGARAPGAANGDHDPIGEPGRAGPGRA